MLRKIKRDPWRPKKNPKDLRSKRFAAKCTESEKEFIKARFSTDREAFEYLLKVTRYKINLSGLF